MFLWFYVFAAYVSASITGVPLIEYLPASAFMGSSQADPSLCIYAHARRSSPQAWCAAENTAGQYLEVDLGAEYQIGSVSVWPRDGPNSYGGNWPEQFVTTYTLKYSPDGGGGAFTAYPDTLNGPQQANTGVDADDEANSVLDPAISARYLQFYPVTYSSHMSMRVEAYEYEATAEDCVLDAGDVCEAIDENSEAIDAETTRIDELHTRIDGVVSLVTDLGNSIGTGDVALGARIDNLVAYLQGSTDADAAKSFGGHVISDGNNVFDNSLFAFTRTELLLLCVNALTILIGLCICWRGGLLSRIRYAKVSPYYETDLENKPIN